MGHDNFQLGLAVWRVSVVFVNKKKLEKARKTGFGPLSRYEMEFLLEKKSDLANVIIHFLKDLKLTEKKAVKFIRCDNAGENKTLENQCKDNELGINFKYMAPGTPQQNGVVERVFVTLYGRVQVMMNEAHFTKQQRGQLWTECASTATKLENMMSDKEDEESPYEKFYK